MRLLLALPLCATTLACAPDADDWDVDTPPRHAYDDSRAPFAEVPADETQWPAFEAPFPQMGEDDGEEGIVYSAALAGYYLMRIQDSAFDQH
jgi:hypothetical protein